MYLDVVLKLLVPLLGGGELGVGESLPEALLREERLQLQEGRHLAVLRDELPVVCEEVNWEGKKREGGMKNIMSFTVDALWAPPHSPNTGRRQCSPLAYLDSPQHPPPSLLSWGRRGSSSPPHHPLRLSGAIRRQGDQQR